MGIFQKSVIKNHFTSLDKEQVDEAFRKFNKSYSSTKISEIKQLKEEEYQDGFLREIFVDVFGYTLKPAENFNLVREYKNQTDGKKADGAILKDGKAIVVIELKSTKTKDLKSITEQAFNYKNNQPDCKYVITSNFQKLRFYIDYANEFEEFDLFNLQKQEFELLYLILHKDSIFSDLPLKLKTETKFHEKNISDKLYKDYSNFKYNVYNNLVENNPEYDKLTLFKKSQKFLDRLLFVFFAEDTGLVPPNAISKIIEQWQTLIYLDEYKTLYSRFVKFFEHLDKGHKYKTYDLPAYNGGLFAADEILNNVQIDNKILKDGALLLSSYDFSTDVDVNILGHIFEHSLNEIEEKTAEIAATTTTTTKEFIPLLSVHSEKNISKRKKDGVFYTPKYITQYIVENTVGKLCTEKREELDISEIEFDGSYKTKGKKLSAKGRKLFDTLENYKHWLLSLKIIDPACGSGAFLNQALSFLIDEHKHIDDIIAELTGETIRLFDTDKAILENNLYGVDINEESVEIARLSLWLPTAQKGRKLSNLNKNIKYGNSLIDDPKIAGSKAFDWNKEFPQIFSEKKKNAWHITTATHNSRYSQRMFDNYVKTGKAIWLDDNDEIIITKTVAEIVKEDKLNVIEYNICSDHMHLLLVCEEEKLTNIVKKIKGRTARERNRNKGINPLVRQDGEKSVSVWTQKFGKSKIENDEYLNNTIEYIHNNRIKHELPKNEEIEKIKTEFLCTREHAFRTEYNGGFDVVIGNPPYVDIKALPPELVKGLFKYYVTTENRINLYSIFIEKARSIVKDKGFVSFINPNSILVNSSYKKIRTLLMSEMTKIIKLPDNVFIDAKVETIIFEYRKNYSTEIVDVIVYPKSEVINFVDNLRINQIDKKIWKEDKNNNYNIFLSLEHIGLLEKIKRQSTNELGDVSDFSLGITPYDKYQGHSEETIKNREFHSFTKIDEMYKPLITGENIIRYDVINKPSEYIKYGNWLGSMRSEKFFTESRIIVRQIVSGKPPRIYAGLTTESLYFTQIGFAIIPKDKSTLKFVLALLNSKLLTYFHKYSYLDIEKDLFQKILIANCKQLPIKEIEQEKLFPFDNKVEVIVNKNKELQRKKTKFLNRLSDNIEIYKMSKKIDSFYDHDFKTLVSELKKKKVALSLLQQDEWEEYFMSYKTEINNLQSQINQTDEEIDQMVYQLYELTEEEIKIVEEGV
ncbi:MAG: N-6 DNA methylase [Bacteroidetes bacterium]|nr:N-6 DNA methylase [Bacteroidota bacterium]